MAMVVLCSRVRAPGRKDWIRLVRLMKFLFNTAQDVLTLSAEDGIKILEWYIDAAFGVHPYYKGHMGGTGRFKNGKNTDF